MPEEFPGQKNKEKLVTILRKHPIVLMKKVIKFLLVFFLSIVLFLVANSYLSSYGNIINIVALALLIISLSYAFFVWMTWFYDLYILTEERVIEIDQKSLFDREVKEIGLDKVQDVTYNISGFLSTIFDVGTVKVHSASGLTIEMCAVSKPGTVREILIRLLEKKQK